MKKQVKKTKSRRPAAALPVARKAETGTRPDIFRRHFWKFAAGLLVLYLLILSFDVDILAGRYDGNMVTRPFYGLHSWAQASGAWACRSHVQYGLDYTKGYTILVVGDPPPENPYRYSNHPQYSKLIGALGMWIFGTHDWSIRVFGLIMAVPMFFLLVYFLKKLFPPRVVLLSVLVMVWLPIVGYFGFGGWLAIVGLWGLWRYMQLSGQIPAENGFRWRWVAEYAIASVIMVQLGWVGTFYALTIGLHYVVFSLLRRVRFRWLVLGTLAVPSLLSLTLNFVVMAKGFESNLEKEQAGTAQVEAADDGKEPPSAIDKIISLYKWRARKAERGEFSWGAWLGKIWEFARSNFTLPVLIMLGFSVVYQGVVHGRSGYARLIRKKAYQADEIIEKTPFRFVCGWYFLLPGVLFLLFLKGVVWEHQYFQSPFVLFAAIGTALGILTVGNWLGRLHGVLGKGAIAVLMIVVLLAGNRGLAAYRDVRWQSPRTIELFETLNERIPPDQDLLTFKDYLIRQSETKIPYYRPEYAFYLNRGMIQANGWPEEMQEVRSLTLEEIVERTIEEITEKAATGQYPYYLLPVRAAYVAELDSGLYRLPQDSRRQLKDLSNEQLQQMLQSRQQKNTMLFAMEKYRRFRRMLAEELAQICEYETFTNPAQPGEENFCSRGNTPCYIFDLSTLKTLN